MLDTLKLIWSDDIADFERFDYCQGHRAGSLKEFKRSKGENPEKPFIGIHVQRAKIMRCYHFIVWLMLMLNASILAHAQQSDPHIIYEKGCAGCHEAHASDFAFERLDIVKDTIVGSKSGKPLGEFLRAGHGGIGPEDVEVLLQHFRFIRQSDRLFETKCRICHDSGKDVSRLELVIREDRLIGRYTQRNIDEFLKYHGRLEPEEIPVIIEMLEYQILTKPDMWP